MIVHVNNEQEYFQAIQDAKDRLIVVDIFATWCPPCRQIAPVFEALSREDAYKDTTVFLKVDIDVWPGIKRHLSVWAMPTFYFLKKKNNKSSTGGGSCKNDCCQHQQQDQPKDTGTEVTVVGSFMGANEALLRRGIANDGKVGICSSMCTIQ